jgi:hypothetical protein
MPRQQPKPNATAPPDPLHAALAEGDQPCATSTA